MSKERTWPYAAVPDTENLGKGCVQKPTARVVDLPPMTWADARRFRDALNEAFDWGRGYRP